MAIHACSNLSARQHAALYRKYLLLMVQKNAEHSDMENPQSLVWFVLLLPLFDPRACANPSLELNSSFGLPRQQLKICWGKNLGIWRVTLKRVHPSKRCHPQVGWFSQDNFLPPPAGWFCGKQNIPGVLWAQKTQHTTLLPCSQRLHSLFPLRVFFVDFPSAAMRVLVALFWLSWFLASEEFWKNDQSLPGHKNKNNTKRTRREIWCVLNPCVW